MKLYWKNKKQTAKNKTRQQNKQTTNQQQQQQNHAKHCPTTNTLDILSMIPEEKQN